MLTETGILTASRVPPSPRALRESTRRIYLAGSIYTGEVEDFFFHIEAELARVSAPTWRGGCIPAAPQRHGPHDLQAVAEGRDRPAGGGGARARRRAAGRRRRSATRLSSPIRTGSRRSPPPSATTSPPRSKCCCATWNASMPHERSSTARRWARPPSRQRVRDRPPPHGGASRLRGAAGELLRLHRFGGLRTATYSAVKLIFLHLGRLVQDLQHGRRSRSARSMCRTPSFRFLRSCRRSAIPCRSSICGSCRR